MIRRLFWLLVAFTLTGEIVSALALMAGPSEEVAAWAGWSFLGLSRARWLALHYGLGALLAVSGLVCLAAGSRRMMASGDDEQGAAPAWMTAVMIFLVVGLASLVGLPPASTLLNLSGQLKAWHAKSFGEPPLPGAASMTLSELSKRLGFDPDKAVANLAAHNVKAGPPGSSLGQIAKENGLVPAAVYETMRGGKQPTAQQVAEVAKPAAPPLLPSDPPPGLGRLKLSDVCEQYGMNLAAAVDRLGKGGLKASGDMTLRQIAQSNLMLPIEVYDALRGVQAQTTGLAAAPHGAPASGSAPVSAAPALPAPSSLAPAPASAPAPSSGPAPASGPGHIPAPGQPLVQAPETAPGQGQLPGQTSGQLPGQPSAQSVQPIQPIQQVQPGAPLQPPQGLEKMTLAAFCREYSVDQAQALAKLKAKGMVVFSDMTFREVAIENTITPEQVMEFMIR
jgi:hypothetical protein